MKKLKWKLAAAALAAFNAAKWVSTAWIATDSASGRPLDFDLDPGISGKKKGKCENVEL